MRSISTRQMDVTPIMHEARSGSRRRPSLFARCLRRLEDCVEDVEGLHVVFKVFAYSIVGLYIWLAWRLAPIRGHWNLTSDPHKTFTTKQDLSNYFNSFEGFSECNIHAADLYKPLSKDEHGNYPPTAFCSMRSNLLRSMSEGGRIGFDAPYMPKGCQYRWFSAAEICFILARFDGLLFIGDGPIKSIFGSFNILLQQDLAAGALNTRSMNTAEMQECRCDNQFMKQDCVNKHSVDADQVRAEKENVCHKTPYTFIEISEPQPSSKDVQAFQKLASRALRSSYKPVPVIHSISPASFTREEAQSSLLGFLQLADESKRKTPMLWIGPTAAGHLEIRGRKGNQEIWDFDHSLAKVAEENDVEVLGMWNMTVQATSWDGVRFGEKVAITQAMMVLNWLSRLESS